MSFLELKPGANYVRLMTKPYQYLCHDKFLEKGHLPFEPKVKCLNPVLYLNISSCILCKDETENRHSRRWIIGLMSRLDLTYYYLDIGWELFSQIINLARDSNWGDPETYDLDFHKDVYNCERPIQVMPIPHQPLTEAEKEFKSLIDLSQLTELTNPPSDSYIEKINNGHYSLIDKYY